jgi:hypothetical protein
MSFDSWRVWPPTLPTSNASLIRQMATSNPRYVKRTDMWSSAGVVAVTP